MRELTLSDSRCCFSPKREERGSGGGFRLLRIRRVASLKRRGGNFRFSSHLLGLSLLSTVIGIFKWAPFAIERESTRPDRREGLDFVESRRRAETTKGGGIFEINETEIRREFPFNGNRGNADRFRGRFLHGGSRDRGTNEQTDKRTKGRTKGRTRGTDRRTGSKRGRLTSRGNRFSSSACGAKPPGNL